MWGNTLDYLIYYAENLWENYPTLRPAIQNMGKVWRLFIIFFRYLAQKNVFIEYGGRQPFLIAYLNTDPIWAFLNEGYKFNELSLKDNNEVWSIRKIVDRKFQIHLRFYTPVENVEHREKYKFELRGHFEYSWDIHPLMHWKAVGMKPVHEETLSILRDNEIEHMEVGRANEQLELENHLKWINKRLELIKKERSLRKQKKYKNAIR